MNEIKFLEEIKLNIKIRVAGVEIASVVTKPIRKETSLQELENYLDWAAMYYMNSNLVRYLFSNLEVDLDTLSRHNNDNNKKSIYMHLTFKDVAGNTVVKKLNKMSEEEKKATKLKDCIVNIMEIKELVIVDLIGVSRKIIYYIKHYMNELD